MKILQINNFHHLLGGADRVYLETADLLESKGHEVQFFSTKNVKNRPSAFDKYFVDDIDYYKLNKLSSKIGAALRFVYSRKAASNLSRLLKEHKPDVAHLHVFQGRLSCSILPVLKKHKVPIVFTMHEYKVLCPVYTFLDNRNEICEACKGKHFYNCLVKKCNNNSTVFSFISTVEAYFRDTLFPIEKYGNHFIMVSDFIYNKHIEYRPNMALKSTRLYNFNGFDFNTKSSAQGDYFLYFGRLSSEKGVLTLLKTFLKIPHIKLKIVGTGAMGDEIGNFIKSNNLTHVEILGYKKGAELNEIISNASFTIVPSEWYESFGLIIIESMALGTPVIASNIGAIPELVKDSENGFLFQPKNIDDLLSKIQNANEITEEAYGLLSENAQRFALTNFTKQNYYEQLIKIYQKSIQSYHEKT